MCKNNMNNHYHHNNHHHHRYHYIFVLFIFATTMCNGEAYDLLKAPDYFESFIANYNKMYDDDWEKHKRYNIFKDNLEEINVKNRLNDTAVYKINKFSDLSKNEIISKYTGLHAPQQTVNFCKTIVLDQPPAKGPLNFDWRNQNKVTSIKNQGACGACWAFATLASVESQHAIRTNVHLNLSEQQMIDCDYVDQGCNGGLLHTAFEQMIEMGGVKHEQEYPYHGRNKQCRLTDDKFAVKIVGCYRYIVVREEKLKDLLRMVGPIPMAIDASDIVNYFAGIINYCRNDGLNHAVLLVGYGVENDIPYWTFKNTWGPDWGEEGYFRVRQNVNACGLSNELASTAVLE
ncbi:Cathepsin [Trabala vishnou gigantina nucleopolyhedrovirus]|uniref:Cathepsin n=1 Tax=Trabala vishnou gigantina nucleopolyhedrovirus TaxID=2863583 RepID=UPI002481CAFA|nr:Cathepsin [Trabala vishnou gigantina nucleopolyhedrovirus]QYC92697.1 Cathepsin [Trabala vishnou gigantina nucleopolyhedrovirus]